MPPPTATQVLNVRLEAIGDSTDTTLLPDANIVYFWDASGAEAILLTAAVCCENLANKDAASFRWSADGESMDLSQRQKQWRSNAAALRRRYFGSGSVQTIQRRVALVDEFGGG